MARPVCQRWFENFICKARRLQAEAVDASFADCCMKDQELYQYEEDILCILYPSGETQILEEGALVTVFPFGDDLVYMTTISEGLPSTFPSLVDLQNWNPQNRLLYPTIRISIDHIPVMPSMNGETDNIVRAALATMRAQRNDIYI